jgi:hypothetical protein
MSYRQPVAQIFQICDQNFILLSVVMSEDLEIQPTGHELLIIKTDNCTPPARLVVFPLDPHACLKMYVKAGLQQWPVL